MKEIGLQLYSVGSYMAQSVPETLKKVAELGYTQVEFAGYFGVDAKEMKKLLDANGLRAISSHANVVGNLDGEIEYMQAAGAEDLVCAGIGGFDSRDNVLKIAELFNQIGEKCRANGMHFSYHNHSHEFVRDETGKWLLDVLYENTDPELVNVQLDVCWALVGGADPVEYLRKYKDRARMVHMKEVKTVSPYDGTAIGKGLVDFKGIYELLGDSVKYIVEQEGLRDMDAFICLTDRDEENLMAGLYAMRSGIPKVIIKNNRTNYSDIISSLGLDSVVSPKQITSDYILRYARAIANSHGSSVEKLYRLLDGKAEALEFVVKEGERFLRKPLRELRIRPNTLVSVIVRGDKIITPFGDDYLEAGDSVLIMSGKSGISTLSEVFT